MSSSQYLHSNPLAEHNSGIALSSKQVPVGGTGNMYMGQAGRAFVQGGGGMSQFHSFDGGKPEDAYAHGSYAPVTVGHNSVTSGGGRRKGRKGRRTAAGRGKKKCDCDIVTGFGGRSRGRRRCRSSRIRNSKCKSCRNKRINRSRSRRIRQRGGNAAYSIAGAGTEVTRSTTYLANPAPYTAYNSCHPVA
jgi:hypothetical protein